MAKQLNVNLAFSANTQQAKAQIQDLQKMLDTLVKGSAAGAAASGMPLTKDLMEAQIAATKLGTILQQSLNTQTGNLDLTKFSDSLNKSGMKLEVLKGQLESLGPTGQKAFLSLASSIVSADVPLTRTNKLVSELWTTMKNTARWQLSSSMLHSFMGTIQSAVGYAKDLNESLNNIRIVTGQSTEQMAAFAERANKAAKALSATTTEYTNASLIYYQQGLSDSEVADRTDITIKMAHASGQSAEIVSDQLTAIWNNFYDGTKSLEHYADVLTALGAATASSSDEISGGLEKFAGIAETIGLSYEYAASALATITATSRESEEVVGTALKTIFARIQGLNLGETLEDGVTLNKYSEALSKVGISIFEQNGELKDMDNILSEMGAKWDTLSKAQQTALAQTVAGVRQYNQLMTLMNNWDSFEDNLGIANNSDGSLQEQADIYAESWQAARDRVKAAAEDIYDSILNDKFFITVLNGFEKLLTGVGEFTDSLNGLPGVFSMLGVILTKVFSTQLSESVDRIAFNLRSLSGQTQRAAEDLRNIAMTEAQSINFNTGTAAGDLQGEALKRRLELQNQIREVSKMVNADQKEQLASLLQINDAYAQQAILAAEAQDKASDKAQESRSDIRTSMRKGGASETDLTEGLNKVTGNMQLVNRYGLNAAEAIQKIDDNFDKAATSSQGFDKEINDIIKGLNLVGRNTAAKNVEELKAKLNSGKLSGAQFKTELQKIVSVQDMLDDTAMTAADKLKHLKEQFNLTDAQCEEYANDLLRLAQATRTADNANDAYTESYNQLQQSINGFQGAMNNFGTSVIKGVQGISQMAMGFNALVAAWDTLNNQDMSFGEKLLSITMSLTMAIPALIGGYQALKEAKLGEALASMKVAAAEMIEAANTATVTAAKGTATAASGSLTFSLLAQAAAWVALQLSISPLLALLLVVAAAIAGIALVAAGLIAAFKAIKNSTPEAKLEALKDKAEKSAEAFNKVQEAVNATKEAIESLETSYDKIDNLTKGTNEWYEAVTKVNAEVMKLMEEYPELLAGQVYATEDGILKISEAGIEAIETENRNRLVAASNVNTINQKAVAEQEVENSYGDFKSVANKGDLYGLGQFGLTTSEMGKAIQDYYDTQGVGETLFTETGAKELMDGIIKATGETYGWSPESFTEEQYQGFYDAIMANADTIRENSAKKESISLMEDSLLQQRVASVNSNRTADEVKDLLGENVYQETKDASRDKVEQAFGDWNNHINYKKGGTYTTNEEWGMIEDFMSMQGDNVEYVAQRNGKMVLEVDGEEIEYTKDEVYDALAELYSGPELESKLEAKLKETLAKTLDTSTRDLNFEELIALDNLRDGIADAFEGTENEENADAIFKSVANTYGTDSEGVAQLQADTQYVDMSSEAFARQALALNEGKIKAEEFTAAVRELNAEGQIAAMGDYFANAAEGFGLTEEAAQDMQDYAEHLRSIAKDSEMLADSLAEDADSAADLSVEIHRMNKGVEDLADGFGDWSDILKKSSKESAEYAKAMKQTKSALSDVLDVEEDLVSDDFVVEHMDEIAKAAEGDADAIDFLRSQMDEEIIANITLGQSDEFIKKINDIDSKLQEIPDIEVGAILQDQAFLDAANELVNTAGMTADEANAYFAGIGYEPVYNEQEIDTSSQNPNSKTLTEVTDIGWSKANVDLGLFGTHQISLPNVTTKTTSIPEEPTEAPASMNLVSFSGESKPPEIKGLRKKATGSQNNYSKSNSGGGKPGGGGGGGSKGSKPQTVKKGDIVERYKEINDQIDNLKDEMSDLSKETDRLYGVNKLNAMKKQNALILKEKELLEKKRKEAEKNLEIDRQALKLAAKNAGVEFTFDGDDISNYTDQMTILYEQLDALTKQAGDTVDEAEQEAIDELQKKIDELKSALSAFEETRELIEDLDNEIQDKFYEWQDNNYEQLQLALELKIEVDDDALRMLELTLKQYEDNFFKMAETAAILGGGKVDNAKSQLATYQSHRSSLDAAFAAGEISEADYMEGIKEVRDGIYEQLEALIDLDKQMMHYYEDTLAAASEELADYTDHMEHLTGVFDHYISLMEILGKQKDYSAMGDFLTGKADTIRDRLEVAQEYYDMLKENSKADEYWTNYQNALFAGDDDMAQWWKEQWDAEVDALDAAQEEMLSLTEEWTEAMKTVIENSMNQIADTLEKSLTDGLGFERLMDNFEKLNTRQEEYLTKTNQIYETNKLMRTASKALDETDNKVAKQKLKNFIDETKSLQENTQLSQYELEIQQAKYDLLLAEIALEEAQNAKSTVRLSRDNEGNFGYVYTADEDKIADAEQAVEDKENALYNISLEGQKNYTEKYLQAQQEMYNSLAELQQMYLNGEIATEEEFKARQAEIINHYFGENGVLTTYSHLYNIAVQTDAAATQDFWATEYGEMTQNTADWQSAVDGYLVQIQEQTQNWKDVSTQANKDVKGALENSKKATKDLTDESESLRKKLVNDVVPAIEREIQSVQAQTSAYAAQRQELLQLIATYQQYLASMNKQVASAAKVGFDKNTDYSAVINDYLVDGGKVGDEVYNQLLTQRDAKIEWLQTEEGGNKDSSYWGTSGSATTDMYNKIYGTDDEWLNGDYFTDEELEKKLHELGIAGYATGGYTGDWGPEGKLAVLHEKELVLNSGDTDNLLKTVGFIREIIHMIDSQASMSSLFSMSATTGVMTNEETLEQTVTIHAEFPNAINHNEIEEAFNNLINTASQYANRK